MSVDTWLKPDDVRVESLAELTARECDTGELPRAAGVEKNVPWYDGENVRRDCRDPSARQALMGEWHRLLRSGPGVAVIRNAVDDHEVIERVSAVFREILDEESSRVRADHFAPGGRNGRIWNVHEKLCVRDPALYARYTACLAIDAAAESWLGPMYQITAQVNLVYPGGQAQVCHRDYHLGFQNPDLLTRFPEPVHRMSASLTLQGAIAHSSMPIESGPTQLLPFSQQWPAGYIARGNQAVAEHFDAHAVQLALEPGDFLFFNPALLHAAGENRTESHERLANLLQIGSAFGRTLEILDRQRMCEAVYPVLLEARSDDSMNEQDMETVIAATAEGYGFPANMDLEPPVNGTHLPGQQDLMREALAARWPVARFVETLAEKAALKRSH